ncbi:tRNA1(Val) (adenine(37)-N6)-methyltransferase [Desulforhopalus singaporensis]|nr:methyltransferase [Desulforhopalus singaporensis]
MMFKKPVTSDTLFNGRVILYQHRDGYRFSMDPVLLAHFAEVKKDGRVLDLGTGCGVIALILAYRYNRELYRVSAIEVQQGLATLARENFKANRKFNCLGEVFRGDIRSIKQFVDAESYDMITCNPPFYTEGQGRQSVEEEARLARHQQSGGLRDFLVAARFALTNRGCGYFIYPAEQTASLISEASSLGFGVKKIRFVYSYPAITRPAQLVMIKCVKNGRKDCVVLDPLYIYREKNGPYTQEVAEYYKS